MMRKVTIALDDASMLTAPEQEIADVKVAFLQNCGECTFIEHDVTKLHMMNRTDVLITDFGGLGVGYGRGAERCGHELMKLIDSRPSTLFILWSAHTESWYKNAIYDAMPAGERDNAEEQPHPSHVLVWRYGDAMFWDSVRAWLGLENVPEETPELLKLIEEQEEISLTYRKLRNKALGVEDEPEPEPEPEIPPDIAEIIRQGEIDEARRRTELDAAVAKQKADRQALREQRERDGTTNDFHADLPKEPDGGPSYGDIIGHITIPVRIEHRPGMTKGFARFKYADCMVEVSNTETDERIAYMGGAMAGTYEAHFSKVEGVNPYIGYMMPFQDMWKAFEAFHAEYSKAHPELLEYEERGKSMVVKAGL